ncbi:hypothetical protein BDV06DRAFT_225161 [Aspergillus oleicola]
MSLNTLAGASSDLIGQLAAYLHVYGVKYGFLTTYGYTIFVRQDMGQDAEGNHQVQLHVSKPIHRGASSSPNTDTLTARQALYYLLHLTKIEDFKFENSIPINEWTTDHTESNLWATKAPLTPARLLSQTPGDAVRHLGPQFTRVCSAEDPIDLYQSSVGRLTGFFTVRDEMVIDDELVGGAKVPVRIHEIDNLGASAVDRYGHDGPGNGEGGESGDDSGPGYDDENNDHGQKVITGAMMSLPGLSSADLVQGRQPRPTGVAAAAEVAEASSTSSSKAGNFTSPNIQS